MPDAKGKYKPGESGNPDGKSKGVKSITATLRKIGEWEAPDLLVMKLRKKYGNVHVRNLTLHQLLWLKVYDCALDGQSWAVSMVAERTEGKVPNEHKLGGMQDGGPFVVRVE